MRNIPLFTTENGIASIVLREIPYSGAAYIRVQEAIQAEALIAQCRDFCIAAGGERVYGTGHPALERYPLHTAILRMERSKQGLPDTEARLCAVTRETLEQWRQLYNEKMASIPNSTYMTVTDAGEMLKRGDGYFVYKGSCKLGIGMASGEEIKALASVAPGAGEEIILALASALTGGRATLEVASANTRAVALYERLGFAITAELSQWFQIL